MKRVPIISLLLVFLTSCDLYNQDDYTELVVVESYMIANRSLPAVRISKTVSVSEEYSMQSSGLSGANVQISLLDSEGNIVETYAYIPLGVEQPGIYRPADLSDTVLPTRSYRLDINFNNRQEVLYATTIVPDQVNIENSVQEEVVYQSDEQLEIVLSPTQRTQSQNFFVFDSISLEPSTENLTPFYRASVVNGNSQINDFIKNSSGLINEGNFTVNQDGTIALKYPWIGAAFYGDNLIVTNSVGKSLADFVRSQEVQLGGSTLSPGEIPNLTYNIDGGIGIFGSISSDTVQTRFLRP